MDINQIAEMAGVSRATVSRYLNDGYVSQEKRERIARVIDETGYVPSKRAQQLRRGRTDVVGVIIPKINSASISRIVAGMTTVLNEAGYQVLLANTENDAARELDFLQLFLERDQVDGIVLVATVLSPAHKKAIRAAQVPVVIVDQSLPGLPCVYQNDYGAVFAATELVLEHAAHPAYLGVFEEDESAGRDRRRGFADACEAAGLEVPHGAVLTAEFSVDSGYSCTEQILESFPQVDAIVCATDSIAFGALTCLRERGRAVPDEIQVTGVGDSELAQIVTPTLTTVHHHYKTSGSEAAKMLVGLMTGTDRVAREVKMSFELVQRRSTR